MLGRKFAIFLLHNRNQAKVSEKERKGEHRINREKGEREKKERGRERDRDRVR